MSQPEAPGADPGNIIAAMEKLLQQQRGIQRNPGRRQAPRQIAGDVLEALQEFFAEIPEMRPLCDEIAIAYLMGKPMPPSIGSCCRWSEFEPAVLGCFEVRDALRAGDIQAAWRAAAGASCSYEAAEERLRPKRRRAEGQRKGGAAAHAVAVVNCRLVRQVFAAGEWPSLDEAAASISQQLQQLHGRRGFEIPTVRKYLNGLGKARPRKPPPPATSDF